MAQLPTRVSGWLLQLLTAQRAVAHIELDAGQRVAGTSGDLDNYGLTEIQEQQPAYDQLPFLEGLLPLSEPVFFIPLMQMPNGRVADVHLLADQGSTWILLLDVSVEHADTRRVQQKAYDMTLLRQREARLMAKLRAAHEELTAAHQALGESRAALVRTHSRLERELRDAERYVRAILPQPLTEPFAVEWRYVPSNELGGDSLGYHWIDSDHFALYLLDVCGHGVGPALLSVAVANTLRNGALRGVDFRLPEQVLGALNRAYQMEEQGDLYFTIWYGVYHPASGRLRYASAGHPPPIVVRGSNEAPGAALALLSRGPALGILPDVNYRAEECALVAPSRLFLFSDGVYEITRPDGSLLEYATFEAALLSSAGAGESELDRLLRFAHEVRGAATLEDDFSIVKMAI